MAHICAHSGIPVDFIIEGSGHFTNTVRRKLVCLLGINDVDYSMRWWDNWLTGLRCPDKASKEDSCPAGVACPTLTVGEVFGVSSILEMDS